MQIQENILLAPYTTFKIGGPARYFCVVRDQFDALEAYEFAQASNLKTFVLGGGSNVLISDQGFDGLVIQVKNSGTETLFEDEQQVLLRVASGENWDGVVDFAVKNGRWGMENLSHIPGSAGAIAVQNVGAYGQEAKYIIESVTVFNKETHEIQSLRNAECGFSYRSSIFNSAAKGKYIIFNINFRLSKLPRPILTYRDLRNRFADKPPGLLEIRQGVIDIRNQKFPFPVEAKNGNAGSFFKNPLMSTEQYPKLADLVKQNFGIEIFEKLESKKITEPQSIKVPAAFLLDICGVKDLQVGGAAVNANQPLVIINKTGAATAEEVVTLATQIRSIVEDRTGISLQFEPELVGF